jgi:hypothetical protein
MAAARSYWLLSLGLLGALLAGSVWAQSPPIAPALPSQKTVESWLGGGDPRLVAWGAHEAAAARDRHLVPELLVLAGNWRSFATRDSDGYRIRSSQEQKDQRDAMAAVIDALIQLHADVPAESLRVLAPNFGNEVAVLLGRMPSAEAEPLALDFYHVVKPSPLQYVSAALLALSPPSGFAADMLSNINVRAKIFVVSPEMGGMQMNTAGDCFVEADPPRKDCPSTRQYVLTNQKREGAQLVVGGIDPVYATTELSTTYSGEQGGSGFGVDLVPDRRLRLIAEMLGVEPAAIGWDAAPQINIAFQSPEQYEDVVRSFVRGEQQKYRATVTALVERGVITPSEADGAEILPRLYLQVNDMRKEASPLPELANLPPGVEIHGPIF